MQANNWSLKNTVLQKMVFPQYPNFCGVASCATVTNTILGTNFSQEDLHKLYGIGMYTKLKIPIGFDFEKDSFENYERQGMGMSNWDIVRLFNTIMLDKDIKPFSLILAGQDFVREYKHDNFEKLFSWLQKENNHAIIHIVDHYVVCAGMYQQENRTYLLCADPSRKKGPINSLQLSELEALAATDNKYGRYGMILLSDTEIHASKLFHKVTDAMFPKETINYERFSRI